jgi:hypothetical protein
MTGSKRKTDKQTVSLRKKGKKDREEVIWSQLARIAAADLALKRIPISEQREEKNHETRNTKRKRKNALKSESPRDSPYTGRIGTQRRNNK